MRFEFDELCGVLIKIPSDGSPEIMRKSDPVWKCFSEGDDSYARAIYFGQGCWERLDTVSEVRARSIVLSWGGTPDF